MCHVSVKNFVSRQRWRLVRLRLKSCCSFPGFPWTLAAASCSPKAGLVKPRTTSSWLTPIVCGRSEQVHQTSRRGRRYKGWVGIKSKISAFCCWINSLSQELNRRLRAPVEAFFTHLCQVAQPCLSGSDSHSDGGAQISLMRQDDGNLRVKLKSELAGLPFYWEFHCSLSPVTVVRSIFHKFMKKIHNMAKISKFLKVNLDAVTM